MIQDPTLEGQLDALPDQVAAFLETWRKMTLERERCEALLYARFKGEDKDRSATEIKEMIKADASRYQAVLNEIKAEAQYIKVYETLMSIKKKASLRVAM